MLECSPVTQSNDDLFYVISIRIKLALYKRSGLIIFINFFLFRIFYYDQQMHNYFTNYHTCRASTTVASTYRLYRVRHKSVNTRVRHKSVNTPLSHERLVVRTWLAAVAPMSRISYNFTPKHYILRSRCVRQAVRGMKGC